MSYTPFAGSALALSRASTPLSSPATTSRPGPSIALTTDYSVGYQAGYVRGLHRQLPPSLAGRSADFIRGFNDGYQKGIMKGRVSAPPASGPNAPPAPDPNYKAGFAHGVSDAQNSRPVMRSAIVNAYYRGYLDGYRSINPAPSAVAGVGPLSAADAWDAGFFQGKAAYQLARSTGTPRGVNAPSIPPTTRPGPMTEGYQTGWTLSYYQENPRGCGLLDPTVYPLRGNVYRTPGAKIDIPSNCPW